MPPFRPLVFHVATAVLMALLPIILVHMFATLATLLLAIPTSFATIHFRSHFFRNCWTANCRCICKPSPRYNPSLNAKPFLSLKPLLQLQPTVRTPGLLIFQCHILSLLWEAYSEVLRSYDSNYNKSSR